MSKRDWQKDWELVTDSVLSVSVEELIRTRAALQYWLSQVRKLEAAAEAAREVLLARKEWSKLNLALAELGEDKDE